MRLLAGFPDRRDLLQVGQHVLHHPSPDVVANPARGDVDDADRRFGELQFRQHAEFLGEHRAADDGVEERGVDRVHRVFQDLQPVARIEIFLARNDPVAWAAEAVIGGECRHFLGRAHVAEHDAVRLAHRIGAVTQLVLDRAGGGLAGRFQDRAVHVEQPAVVAAADALGADQAELQRGAAVGAMPFKEADGAGAVAEGDQFLAEDFERDR